MSEFSDSFHQLTTSIISQLVAFMQLRYRANDQSSPTPFATHPTTMYVAVSSFMLYYLLHVALLRSSKNRRFADLAHHFMVWSAYVAVSTLTAVVFPDRASPFIYVIFGLLSAGELSYMFENNFAIEGEAEADVEVEIEIEEDKKEDEEEGDASINV